MTSPGTRPPSLAASAAALPPERAFVIQLREAAEGDTELFTGRAEHIASGVETRFASGAELIAFVRQVLASGEATTVPETSGKPE